MTYNMKEHSFMLPGFWILILSSLTLHDVTEACPVGCTCNLAAMQCLNTPDLTDIPTDLSSTIQQIWVDGANITHLVAEYFMNYADLSYVIIINSNVASLDHDTFWNCSNLSALVLTNNSLTERDWYTILAPTPVGMLDLSGNRLQTFDYIVRNEFLIKPSGLDLRNNRLHCNCKLIWLLYAFEVMKQVPDPPWPAEGDCYTPAALYGMDLITVPMEELRCSGPIIPRQPISQIHVQICFPLEVVCSADGDPTPTMSLTHPDGSSFQKTTLDQDYNIATGSNKISYVTHEAWLTDGGVYLCNVSGYSGWTTYKITVQVIGSCGSCVPCTTEPDTTDTPSSTTSAATTGTTTQQSTTTHLGLADLFAAVNPFRLASAAVGVASVIVAVVTLLVVLKSNSTSKMKKPI